MRAKIAVLLVGAAVAATLVGCSRGATGYAGTQELPADDYVVGGSLYYDYGDNANRAVKIEVDESYFWVKDAEGNEAMADIEAVFGAASEDFSYFIDDATVSLYMSQDYYTAFEAEMSASVRSSFRDYVDNAKPFPYVTDIQANGDYSQVTIAVDQGIYVETMEAMEEPRDDAPGAAAVAALLYQQFTPTGIVGCTVRVLDKDSGSEMGSFQFPSDLFQE